MADPPPSPPPAAPPPDRLEAGRKRLTGYRDDFLKLLALGLPTLLVQGVFKGLADRLLSQPWQALWLLGPLAVATWILWRALKGQEEFQLRRRSLLFLAAYVSCFSLAAGTRFLDWSRDLTVFGQPAPRSWLAPNWAGDWRYRLVPKKPRLPDDLVIVTLEEPARPNRGEPDRPAGEAARRPTREEARLEVSRLIALAAREGARGIALDFTFEGASLVDGVLCHAIQGAGIPVLLSYGFERTDGALDLLPPAPALEACVPEEGWGHPVALRDRDRLVRSLPLFFRQQQDLPALSLRVARLLVEREGGEVEIPPGGLLHFVEPREPFPQVSMATLAADPEARRRRLRERFVLVGEDSERDRHPTPFGEKAGVLIHADAVHSLRHRHFLRRTPWWTSFAAILVLSYLIVALAARGAPARRLLAVTAAASVAVVAASVLALYAALLWVEVVYPLVALWLLLPLVLLRRRRPAPSAAKS